jgi:hypothetical protein
MHKELHYLKIITSPPLLEEFNPYAKTENFTENIKTNQVDNT